MPASNRVTIIEALQDPRLFGGLPAFKDLSTWAAWLVFLKAVHGLPMDAQEERIFCQHTGRSRYAPPPGGYPESVGIVGVQSGKTQIVTKLAGHAALTGDAGTHALLVCQDHRGAMRVSLRYAREPFETLDAFKAEVVRSTADTVELRNGVSLSAYPCRPEAVRGIRACIVVIDELAFFTATDGRPTDQEMLRVARGRLATTGGKLIVLSSPYGQSGALWDLYRKHYGREDSTTLIWQASAPQMNPTLPANYLERMAQDDPEAYRSEVLGEFRAGLSTLLDPDALAACVDLAVRERPRQLGPSGTWFWDSASGTGQDKFVVARAHHDPQRDLTVLDVVRSWAPPFNPSGVIAEAAALMKAYGEVDAVGDRYAPGFVLEQARAHGVTYRFSEKDRSQLYLDLLPLVNAAHVRLLDVPELLRELRGLERRRGTSGKDRVDHRPGQHDDLANAAAGALTVAAQHAHQAPFFFMSEGRVIGGAPVPSVMERVAAVGTSLVQAIAAGLAATQKALTPENKKSLPIRSIAELEFLYPADRSPEEEARLAAHYAKQKRDHIDSAFEQMVKQRGVYFPSDDDDGFSIFGGRWR